MIPQPARPVRTVLLTLIALALGLGFADPFVWPASWTVESDEPSYGGTIRQLATEPPATFNPLVGGGDSALHEVVMGSGASLLKRDLRTRAWIPYAADRFEVSADGTVVEFTLREGVAWSDGTPVRARDYVFHVEALLDDGVGADAREAWFVDGAPVRLEAEGDQRLRATFPAPDRLAFARLAALVPLPEHVLGEVYRQGGGGALRRAWDTETDPRDTVWSSAFVPVAYDPNQRLRLARNPHFGAWNVDSQGRPLPYLDAAEITIVPTDSIGLNLYLAGQIDTYTSRSLDDLSSLLLAVNSGQIDASTIPDAGATSESSILVFNWNKAGSPFEETLFRTPEFRAAMSHLIDREAITELVYGGSGLPVRSVVPAPFEQWPVPDRSGDRFDPDRASRLLRDLGFRRGPDGDMRDGEGRVLEFTLATVAGRADLEQIALIFADSARTVGAKVGVEAIDFNLVADQLLDSGDDRPFDALLLPLAAGSEAWPFSYNEYACDGSFHLHNLSGDCLTGPEGELAELQLRGLRTLDDDAAAEIALRMQELAAELRAFLYTAAPTLHASWLNRVGGVHPAELVNELNGVGSLELMFLRP